MDVRLAKGGAGQPLLLRLETQAGLWKQGTFAGVDILPGLLQCSLRGIDIGIGMQ